MKYAENIQNGIKSLLTIKLSMLFYNDLTSMLNGWHGQEGEYAYTWNEVPNSHQVKDRADKLKRAGLWQKVRDRYLEKKNMYLFRPDHNHPSFVVYVEAVNEVYSRYFNRGGGYSVQSIF